MPRTAYNYYLKDKWSKLIDGDNKTKVRLIAQEWKSLKQEVKDKYTKMAAEDRERYRNELKKMS